MIASPLARGAGLVSSLTQADGITIIPANVQVLETGAKVHVRLNNHVKHLDRTIFITGSHDMTLDVVSQELAKYKRRVITSNVGSQGGLVALRRKEAHLAGSHLLDPETGDYNTVAVKKYLEGIPLSIISWVGRKQGLMIKKGNEKQINCLQDLCGPEITFVNRQRGSGTRVLLDYHLQKEGISASLINGYESEEYTHLAVAAAVASGKADCGLGIASAAEALNLFFIPLYDEIYELVIPAEYREAELLAPLFEIMQSDSFKKQISVLRGYNIEYMGRERIIE